MPAERRTRTEDMHAERKENPLGRMSRYGTYIFLSICIAQPLGEVAEMQRVPLGEVISGKPDAGNPHVRFEEGGGNVNCTAYSY